MSSEKIKILVVEDDIQLLLLWKEYLQYEGYQVNIVSNGKAALQSFDESRPSLILLDIKLPDIDGYTLCRLIRQHSLVPIIMVSGVKTEDEDKIEGLTSGALLSY